MKQTWLAYILWFFLGWLGIHKFYVGKTGMGILYIVLNGAAWVTSFFFMGWFFWLPWGILMLIDLFTLPRQVREANGGY